MITRLCDLDPLHQIFISKIGVYTGIYYFLIFVSKK